MCCSLKINSVENYFRWLCLSLTLQSRCQFTVANFQQGVRALWARSGTYSDGFFLASGSTFDIGSNAPRAAAYCEAGCNSEIWPRQGLKSSLQVVCALAHPWVATDIIVKIFDSSLFPPSGQFLRCQLIYSSRLPWQVWEYPELCLESGGLDIVSGYRWYQSTGGCKSDLWPRQGPKSSIQVGLCITTFLSLQTVRLLLPYHLLISETCWL